MLPKTISYCCHLLFLLFALLHGNSQACAAREQTTSSQPGIRVIYTVAGMPSGMKQRVEMIAYKGYEEQLLGTDTLDAANDTCFFVVDAGQVNTIVDIRVGRFSSSVAIPPGREIRVTDSFSRLKENLVTRFSAEQHALAILKEYYSSMATEVSGAGQMLDAAYHSASPENAQTYRQLFLKRFYNARISFNHKLDEIHLQFPNTIADRMIRSALYFPELPPGGLLTKEYIRDHFFDRWDLRQDQLLTMPMIAFEVAQYIDLFGRHSETETKATLDVFFKKLSAAGSTILKDYFEDFLIVQLLQSANIKAENCMAYLYQHHISGCTEGRTQNRFLQSLANIDAMKEGRILPDILLPDRNGTIVALHQQRLRPLTLVFLWKPHCPYCEDLMPSIRSLAKRYPEQLQVYAVSLDNDEREWNEMTKVNISIPNWTDVSEHQGFEGRALSKYFFKGTPTIFLVNSEGRVLSRTGAPEQLEQIIKQPSIN